MKKILSLTLAALLLVSMIPTAMAAETNPASQGTTITAAGTKSEAYTVTVPATMNPGQTGNVTASGSWAANKTLKVTCPSSVDLYNGDDKMSVGVTFAGLELAGDNVDPIAETSAAITIATVDTSAFFGTWTGTLTYSVEVVTESNLITFTIDGTEYQAEKGMTWANWVESEYNTTNVSIQPGSQALVMVNNGRLLNEYGNNAAPTDSITSGHDYNVAYPAPETPED